MMLGVVNGEGSEKLLEVFIVLGGGARLPRGGLRLTQRSGLLHKDYYSHRASVNLFSLNLNAYLFCLIKDA